MRLQINCDEGASRTIFYLDESSVEQDECEPVIIMNSPSGCPVFSMPALWRWADTYAYLIGALLIVVGSCLIQFGGKYYLASIVTINTFGMMFLVLFSLFGIVMPFSTPQFIVWICVFMSIFIGLGLGLGAYQWPKFGIISIGIFAGGLLGLLFYTVCFSNFGN